MLLPSEAGPSRVSAQGSCSASAFRQAFFVQFSEPVDLVEGQETLPRTSARPPAIPRPAMKAQPIADSGCCCASMPPLRLCSRRAGPSRARARSAATVDVSGERARPPLPEGRLRREIDDAQAVALARRYQAALSADRLGCAHGRSPVGPIAAHLTILPVARGPCSGPTPLRLGLHVGWQRTLAVRLPAIDAVAPEDLPARRQDRGYLLQTRCS